MNSSRLVSRSLRTPVGLARARTRAHARGCVCPPTYLPPARAAPETLT